MTVIDHDCSGGLTFFAARVIDYFNLFSLLFKDRNMLFSLQLHGLKGDIGNIKGWK